MVIGEGSLNQISIGGDFWERRKGMRNGWWLLIDRKVVLVEDRVLQEREGGLGRYACFHGVEKEKNSGWRILSIMILRSWIFFVSLANLMFLQDTMRRSCVECRNNEYRIARILTDLILMNENGCECDLWKRRSHQWEGMILLFVCFQYCLWL